MPKVIVSAVAGFLLSLGLLYLFWVFAPYPLIDGEAYESALQEALSSHFNAAPTEPTAIYIKPDLRPMIRRLQARFPQRHILPWSQRPADFGCEESNGHAMTRCPRDDYVSVDCVIFPLWRTAFVTLSSGNSGSQQLLIQIGSNWKIVSTKGYVI